MVARKSPPDLSGVRLKLDRAEHHIESLSAEIQAFRQRKPKPFGFRTEERQDRTVRLSTSSTQSSASPLGAVPSPMRSRSRVRVSEQRIDLRLGQRLGSTDREDVG